VSSVRSQHRVGQSGTGADFSVDFFVNGNVGGAGLGCQFFVVVLDDNKTIFSLGDCGNGKRTFWQQTAAQISVPDLTALSACTASTPGSK
jgi:hypothetical protein